MSNKHPRGFTAIEGVILIGVVLLLAGVGYVGWKAFSKSNDSKATTATSTHRSAQVITTKEDLEAAEKALGELDFDDSDASKAETQASF